MCIRFQTAIFKIDRLNSVIVGKGKGEGDFPTKGKVGDITPGAWKGDPHGTVRLRAHLARNHSLQHTSQDNKMRRSPHHIAYSTPHLAWHIRSTASKIKRPDIITYSMHHKTAHSHITIGNRVAQYRRRGTVTLQCTMLHMTDVSRAACHCTRHGVLHIPRSNTSHCTAHLTFHGNTPHTVHHSSQCTE